MRQRTSFSVVVVDRDLSNCMLLREICRASAWNVAGCAQTIAEGQALVARERPDCLITEYRFDGAGTGLDLIASAKRLVPNLFTVMLTAWDINDVATHVTTHQPDRILRKPIPPHIVVDMLEGAFQRIEIIRINAV